MAGWERGADVDVDGVTSRGVNERCSPLTYLSTYPELVTSYHLTEAAGGAEDGGPDNWP